MKLMQWVIFVFLFASCKAVVNEKPAEPEVVIIPVSPGSGFIWVNDSWHWNRGVRAYQIKQGHWVKPRGRRVRWIEGHWQPTRGRWRYVNGHWG